MGHLHTDGNVYCNDNKFHVGLGISSREAQFLQHTRNVMKMTLLYSQSTVRGKYQTHVRQQNYNGGTSAEMY